MKITRVVMNEVMRIVPVDFIVEMKLLLNVPFRVFLFLSYVKYHYTTLAWIQNSLKPQMKKMPQRAPNTQKAKITHWDGSYVLTRLLLESYSMFTKSYQFNLLSNEPYKQIEQQNINENASQIIIINIESNGIKNIPGIAYIATIVYLRTPVAILIVLKQQMKIRNTNTDITNKA